VAVMVMLAGIIVTAAWMAGNRKFEFDKDWENKGDVNGQTTADGQVSRACTDFCYSATEPANCNLLCDPGTADCPALTLRGRVSGLNRDGVITSIPSFKIKVEMAGCTQQFDAELADKNPFAAQISKNAADTGRLQVTFTAVGYHDSSPMFLPQRNISRNARAQGVLPPIFLTKKESANAAWAVKGKVFDVTNFRPLPADITLCKAAGNVKDKQQAFCPMTVTSTSNGSYSFSNVDFPPPYVLLAQTRVGLDDGGSYVANPTSGTYVTKQVPVKAGQSASRAGTFIPLVPPVPAGQMRIVFTWQSLMVDKKLGQDLELHMTFQGSPTQKCHVYAGNPRCGDAVLTPNYLSGGGYGVEHILLTKIKKSKYTVWYSNKARRAADKTLGTHMFMSQSSVYTDNRLVRTIGSNAMQSAQSPNAADSLTAKLQALAAAPNTYDAEFAKFVVMCIDASGSEIVVSAIEEYMSEKDIPECS